VNNPNSKIGKLTFSQWLSGHYVILARLGIASILAVCVVLPLVLILIVKVTLSMPVTRFVVTESVVAESYMQERQPVGKEAQDRQANSVVPRVFAYGIQVAGILSALAGTLWTIVALSRVE
jgi:hypothetical protein